MPLASKSKEDDLDADLGKIRDRVELGFAFFASEINDHWGITGEWMDITNDLSIRYVCQCLCISHQVYWWTIWGLSHWVGISYKEMNANLTLSCPLKLIIPKSWQLWKYFHRCLFKYVAFLHILCLSLFIIENGNYLQSAFPIVAMADKNAQAVYMKENGHFLWQVRHRSSYWYHCWNSLYKKPCTCTGIYCAPVDCPSLPMADYKGVRLPWSGRATCCACAPLDGLLAIVRRPRRIGRERLTQQGSGYRWVLSIIEVLIHTASFWQNHRRQKQCVLIDER